MELGFCDEIMFQPASHAEPLDNSFAFSRRAVTNSLLDKLRAKVPKPLATIEQPRTKASDLDKRLALLQ
jgi:ATP-dependent Clp protease protease subunit